MFLTNKMVTSFASGQTNLRPRSGQRVLPAFLLCLALAACGGSGKPVGTVGHVEGFAGMVAAEEPRAALVGRDVLSAGGSPADAAVAMAFTLSVTMPSQASLGAGGVCMVYDRGDRQNEKPTVEALDFIAPAPTGIDETTSRPSAVPALPRGFFALHSRYGRLRWAELVGSAEAAARLGVPASRAFIRQLDPLAGPLFQDASSRQVFAKADGRPLGEGDLMTQPDLGATLSRLRTRGVGGFYSGPWAKDLVDEVRKAGGSLTAEELRTFVPKWEKPIAVPYGDDTAYFPPPPAAAGLLEAQYWALLAGRDAYSKASDAIRPHLLAEVFARGFADRQRWMNPDGTSHETTAAMMASTHLDSLMSGYSDSTHHPLGGEPPAEPVAGTGLLAVAADGRAVVCNIGLNNPFGIGRIAPETGIVLGAGAGVKGRGPQAMGPMLAINTNSNEFRFAAAASGGPAAPTALVGVALSSLIGNEPLDKAVADKRSFASQAPDVVFVEPGYSAFEALRARGHEVKETPLPSQVNAARCKSGSPDPSRCQVATDPRGAGLAVMVGR